MADFIPWQSRFADEAEWRTAKAELATLRTVLPPAEYDRLWAQGTLADIIAAKSKPTTTGQPVPKAVTPPAVVNTPKVGPSPTEKLLDAQNKYVAEQMESSETYTDKALTEAEKDAIRKTAGMFAAAPRTDSGERSPLWDSLTNPEPGSWASYIPEALRPQKLMSREETEASKAAMEGVPVIPTIQKYTTTTDPQSGETYENTLSWLGRVLSAPTSAVVGALDPSTTISERVKEGEGLAGGARDLAKVFLDVGKEPEDKGKTFLERPTSERALLGLVYTAGFVGDLLVPFDLGVGDAAKAAGLAAKAADVAGTSKLAAGAKGALGGLVEANTLGRIPVVDPRIAATQKLVEGLSSADMAAIRSWGAAARASSPSVDVVQASEAVLKRAEELGLPRKMDTAQAVLRLADKEAAAGTDLADAVAKIGSARRVADAVNPGAGARSMTRIGNVVVENAVVPKVKAALEASPLSAARKVARVVDDRILIEGDAATSVADYLVDTGVLARWRGENPRAANIVTKGAKEISVTPDEWNDLVRLAGEQEAFNLSGGTATKVTDIVAGEKPSTSLALTEGLVPKPLQSGTFPRMLSDFVSREFQNIGTVARDIAGFPEKAVIKGAPPFITEWLAKAEKMVSEAPNLVLQDLRAASREGRGVTSTIRNPIAATKAVFASAVKNREAFQTVLQAAYRPSFTGGLPRKPVDLLSTMLGDARGPAKEIMDRLLLDPDTRVSAIANAMTEPGKELDNTIRILHALKGKTLGDLLSAEDRAMIEGIEDLGLLDLRVSDEMTQAPVATISAFLVSEKRTLQAKAAAAEFLKATGSDPVSSGLIRMWVAERVDRILTEVKAKGLTAEYPEDAIKKFVVDDLLTDMARGDIATLRDGFQGTNQLDTVSEVRSPAQSLHSDLGQGRVPTQTQVASSLAQASEIYERVSTWNAPAYLMEAIEAATPNLPAGSKKILASRVQALVSADGDLAKQFASLPLTSSLSISDEFNRIIATSGNVDEIESLLAALPVINSSKPAGLITAWAEGLSAGFGSPSRAGNTVVNLARQGMLAGYWLPNLGFHAANILTAPSIIWGTLGGDRAIGTLRSLIPANTATRFLYARLGGFAESGADILVRSPTGGAWTTEQVVKIAVREGALGGQASAEITSSVLEDVIRQSGMNAGGLDVGVVRDVLRRNMNPNAMGYISEIAQTMDSRFRFGVLIDSLKRGEDEATAAKLAREALFNYDDISDIERSTVSKLVWFYSFLRSSVVNFADALVNNPGRVRNILRTTKGARGLELNPPTDTSDPTKMGDKDVIFSSMMSSRPLIPGSLTQVILNDKQTEERYAIFGPPIPMADAVNTIAGVLSMANVLVDPEYTVGERVTGFGQNVAEDLSARSGPFVGLAYDLATGRRPSTFGPRVDPDKIEPEYVVLLQATGLWESFKSLVPVVRVNSTQAPEGKEVMYFDGLYYKIEDTGDKSARRTWAALRDLGLALAVDRPMRDTLGAAVFYASIPTGTKIQPGADFVQDMPIEDALRVLGAIRFEKAKTYAEKSDEQKTRAAQELRDRTPNNR